MRTYSWQTDACTQWTFTFTFFKHTAHQFFSKLLRASVRDVNLATSLVLLKDLQKLSLEAFNFGSICLFSLTGFSHPQIEYKFKKEAQKSQKKKQKKEAFNFSNIDLLFLEEAFQDRLSVEDAFTVLLKENLRTPNYSKVFALVQRISKKFPKCLLWSK